MKDLPTLSVIMPSFNQAAYLKEALDSILSQGYSHCEVIVMDGGSTDGSVELLRSYGDKIQWVSERDKGQSDALNKGFARATGEIIGWLNSDDRFEPGALHAAGRFFAENPDTLWAFGNCTMINETGCEVNRWISAYKDFKLRHYSYEAHLVGNFVSQMGVFFRRKVLDELGGIDENLYYAMDYDFWLRIGKRYSPGILPGTLGAFRVYQTSKSMSNFEKRFAEDYAIAKNHTQGLPITAQLACHPEAQSDEGSQILRYAQNDKRRASKRLSIPNAGWILFKHRINNTLIATMYKIMIRLNSKKES